MGRRVDLTALNLDRDQTYLVRGLLEGLLAPYGFKSVIAPVCSDWTGGILKAVNETVQGHGVKAIRGGDGEVIAIYVNMGDTYTSTVVVPVSGRGWLPDWDYGAPEITSWGDWYKAWLSREAEEGRHHCPNCGTIGELEQGQCQACGYEVFEA